MKKHASREMCCVLYTSVECETLCLWLCLRSASPAQRPEPGQVVGVVHAVADGDDFMEALNLNTEHLHRETLCQQGLNLHSLSSEWVCVNVSYILTQNGSQAYFEGIPSWAAIPIVIREHANPWVSVFHICVKVQLNVRSSYLQHNDEVKQESD